MISEINNNLTRIGIFYDGNYFSHVNNYYYYSHERQSWINIAGLHDFIKHKVAELEKMDVKYCQITDSHYFKGRLKAHETTENKIHIERIIDDILMQEGVTTHFLPVRNIQGTLQEKGIDVWLALEAFELTLYKKFNIVVLVACDGDFVPLVRKLNTLGVRVMLLTWQYEYTDTMGNTKQTRASLDLIKEVSYPMQMIELIEKFPKKDKLLIDKLFYNSKNTESYSKKPTEKATKIGEICTINRGYGFIKNSPENLFFHYQSVLSPEFKHLKVGDKVSYIVTKNEKGKIVATDLKLIS